MTTRTAFAALIAVVFTTCAISTAHAELTADQTARVLAGLENDAFKAPGQKGRKARVDDHVKSTSKSWVQYERKYGKRLESWSKEKLERTDGETIFYPFAGPDFPTAHRLYPSAKRYVMIALQTAGRVPDLEGVGDKRFNAIMRLFSQGIKGFSQRGFFLTIKMTKEFEKSAHVEGITGVMLAFVAREGYDVVDVQPIRVDKTGVDVEVHPGSRTRPQTWASVRFKLKRRSDGSDVILDYLQLDLSDGNLTRNAPHKTFIRNMAGNRVVLKAASHLMQYTKGFHTIKDAILERSPTVIQDETGLAYTDMQKHFEIDLYGDFSRVNILFKNEPQSELADAYIERGDVRNLPFELGYRKESGSCLQVGHKRLTEPKKY